MLEQMKLLLRKCLVKLMARLAIIEAADLHQQLMAQTIVNRWLVKKAKMLAGILYL